MRNKDATFTLQQALQQSTIKWQLTHKVVLRLTFRIEQLDLRKFSFGGERKTGVLGKKTVGL